MNITVEFISPLNSAAGANRTLLAVPEGGTLANLVGALREQFPNLFPAGERAMFMIDQTLARRETVLRDGDRVLMMQLLGGG
jgi:molybdopterin converting factor small subunit